MLRNCLLLCAAAWSASAGAQTPSVEAEVIVVTANRLRALLTETIQHTTVITREEIQRANAPDAVTLLRREAGVELAQTGGVGKESSTFLRGTESDHTLVLIDGVRLNSVSAGKAALEQISPDQIERIEIVRGNVSSLYGSEAIGGVIQIFTRRDAPGASVSAAIGTERTARLGAGFSAKAGATGFGVNVSTSTTDGFSAIAPAFLSAPFVARPGDEDDDGYRNLSVSSHLSHEFAEGHQVEFSVLHSEARVEFDGFFQNSSKPRLTTWSIASTNRFGSRWTSRVSLAQGIDDLKSYLDSAFVDRFKTTNSQLNWHNEVALSDDIRLALGWEHLHQDLDSNLEFTGTTRRVNGAYASLLAERGPHNVQVNLRYDRYSDFGHRATWLAGYGYEITSRWRANATLSTAYKAPTFNELYFPNFGNPDLDPERARSAEVGLQYAADNWLTKLVWFDNRISDLITITEVGPNTFRSTNLERAKNTGIELSHSMAWRGFHVRASLTAQDPVDRDSGARLRRRAKLFGSLALDYETGPWQFGGEVLASANREDFPIDFSSDRVVVPGYAILNLTARYRLGERTDIGLRVDNLFDKEYQLVHGYNTQPRGALVSLRHRF